MGLLGIDANPEGMPQRVRWKGQYVGTQCPSMPTPYEIAKAGGKHAGLVRRYSGEPERLIEKSLQSLEKRIVEHVAKISDPTRHVAPQTSELQLRYLVGSYWPKEIEGFRTEAAVLRGLLEEKKRGQ
jgi:hypothetical protein